MKIKTTALTGRTKSLRRHYREIALQLFEEGMGYKRVASHLNLSMHTVRDWHRLYRCGSFEPKIREPGNSPANVIDKETKEQIKRDYEGGATIGCLSMKYKKCKSTIRYLLT